MLALPLAARAELADRDKPVNLEADTMTVDDVKKVSVYQGNVVLTQGTLMIRADKLVVTEGKDGSHHGTAHGNPATFRQKREGLDEYVEGFGQRIEYDSGKDVVELFTQARMKRNQDEVRGNYISYDGKTEFFKVIGGKEAVTANNPRGRVRAVRIYANKPGIERNNERNNERTDTLEDYLHKNKIIVKIVIIKFS